MAAKSGSGSGAAASTRSRISVVPSSRIAVSTNW